MNDVRSVPLSDRRFFSFISGLWKGKMQPFQTAAVLRSTNFRGDGLLSYENIAVLDVDERQLDARALRRGDIVIERSGGGPKQPVGRVAYFDPPDERRYATSNFTTALRVIDPTAFDPEYVCLFLHSLYLSGATETLQRATTGIRNLDWKEYQSFEIPKLLIDEQTAVATFVKNAREAALTEGALISTLTDLKRAAMRTLFTRGLRGEAQKETDIGPVPESWDVVSFGSVRKRLQYGTSTRCTYEPDGLPVLRIPNIEPGRVNSADLKFGKLPREEAGRYRLEDGDLIFIRTNGVLERLGSCAVYAGEPANALFASYLIRAQLNREKIDPSFAAFFYGSEIGTSIVAGRATPAADGKYNLNTGTIDSLPLPLPPTLDEQREIVAILEAVDRKIDLHKRKRAVLDELFKSLLHKLMTGEIRSADLEIPALSRAAPVAEVAA
jgi:type I restriction enzyme S subunit